jgi:hypothetical protein
MARDALEDALSGAISQIKIPLLSALVGSGVDCYFHFEDLILASHQEMLMEMLTEAEQGAPSTPVSFAQLSPSERLATARYLVMAETGLEWSWSWLYEDSEKEWRKRMADDEANALASADWLKQNGMQWTPINARFGIAFDPKGGGEKYLDILPLLAAYQGSQPSVAVNYDDTNAIRNERLGLESAAVGVDFATNFIPIPFVGTASNWIYDGLALAPANVARHWEARLSVVLEELQQNGNQNWSAELDALDAQRVNPFELTRASMEQLIVARRKMMGL